MKNFNELRSFKDVLSPLSTLILSSFLCLFIVILQPTSVEIAVLLLVDGIAFALMQAVDRKLYPRLHPDSCLYFPEVQWDKIKNLNFNEKLALFYSLSLFPKHRAIYVFLTGFLKLIPAYIVIVFYFQYEGSPWMQFLKAFGISLITCTYYCGAVFIESHALASRYIADFHNRFNWQDVFGKAVIPYSKKDFQIQETIVIVSVWVFVTLLQWLLIYGHQAGGPHSKTMLSFQLIVINLSGLALITRIWYLWRHYFLGGLQKIFHFFENFNPGEHQQLLALHTASILGHFELIINSLLDRLHAYEREMSQWVFRQTELSRYHALGEISALIVHDLSSPLHVIHFCTEQLKENPEFIKDPRYLNQLTLNGTRSLELIDSLRTYLKNQNQKSNSLMTPFGDAHQNVMRLLETQFSTQGFHQIQIDLDPKLAKSDVNLTPADLMHILLNLYSNSIKNLLTHKIQNPKITVRLHKKESHWVQIYIQDNGTGLTQEHFDQLTDNTLFPSGKTRNSLGLRLIRRLIENQGGQLSVVSQSEQEKGTLFSLRFKTDVVLINHQTKDP